MFPPDEKNETSKHQNIETSKHQNIDETCKHDLSVTGRL